MKGSPPARALAIVAAVCLLAAIAVGARYENRRVPVTEVFSPTFPAVAVAPLVDGVKGLDVHLKRPSGFETLRRFVPDQAGALWISLIVLFAVGFDYARPSSGRNLDLVLAQGVGWCLMGSIDLLESAELFGDPNYRALIRLVFIAVSGLTVVLAGRLLWRFRSPDLKPWTITVDRRAVAAIATLALSLNMIVPFFEKPDDSSYFTDLGGQRLVERGRLPYGDPMLTKTPGAAYGPLMYVVQAGMQVLLAEPMNELSPDLPRLGPKSEYVAPSPLPAQISLALFQALAAYALFVVGRRWGGDAVGFAFIALYAGSAYVLGFGGTQELIGGITYVSHILPPAVTLLAFAFDERPAVSGALLATAAGLGFYPAFFFPAWLFYQWGRSRTSAVQFAGSFLAVCLAVGVWVLLASRPAPPLGLVATILRDTLGHHTDLEGYGSSTFGLWGQQTGVLRWMLQPLSGASALSSPFFLLFCGYLAASALLARNAGAVGLALITATIAMGANIWKIHATASYVTWYYPFLILGTLGPGSLVRRLNSNPIDDRTDST
jgi:hypothetical protein